MRPPYLICVLLPAARPLLVCLQAPMAPPWSGVIYGLKMWPSSPCPFWLGEQSPPPSPFLLPAARRVNTWMFCCIQTSMIALLTFGLFSGSSFKEAAHIRPNHPTDFRFLIFSSLTASSYKNVLFLTQICCLLLKIIISASHRGRKLHPSVRGGVSKILINVNKSSSSRQQQHIDPFHLRFRMSRLYWTLCYRKEKLLVC